MVLRGAAADAHGDNPALSRAIDGVHQFFEWSLLILVGAHVAAALLHLFITATA